MTWWSSRVHNIFRGRTIQLQEFPALLSMESHTGFCGSLFTTIWILVCYSQVQKAWGTSLLVCTLGIGVAYFALAWLAMGLSNALRESILETPDDPALKEKLEVSARVQITFLSGMYVLICCFLIYITGGATSPFSAFYVMIFTLTISKNTVPYPGFFVLGYFFVGITVACGAYVLWPWPISTTDMTTIHESIYYVAMHYGFIAASLIVPAGSKLRVFRMEQRAKARGQRA